MQQTGKSYRAAAGAVFWAILAVFFGIACSTSPFGRNQATLFPDAMMNSQGEQAFTEIKRKTPIERDLATNRYVKCVAEAILRETHDPTGVRSWETVVFRDATANAFALPGGKIGVHTGILKVAKTPDQLAAILGHEVGHVIARHGNERATQQVGVSVAVALAQKWLAGDKGGLTKEQQGAIAVGMGLAQLGFVLPFSRSHESEADHIGVELMADAGFDPAQSIELWKNMAKAGGGGPPEFLSTHPANSTRIDQLQSWQKDARPRFERARAKGKVPGCQIPGGMLFFG
ncbi:MAG: M48 family metallopeptidase [Bdellovibrionales bacterium]|nr:M48 family metallopeptidase [Bdellovibrionales bacterium]